MTNHKSCRISAD